MKKRSPNLRDAEVEVVTRLLDSWSGKPTWGSLIAAVQARLGSTYTRQALAKHTRIQAAFSRRVESPLGAYPPPKTYAQQREATIRVLKEKVARYQAENDALLEQFTRWLVNAAQRGVTEAQLNRPLDPIDRANKKRRGPVAG